MKRSLDVALGELGIDAGPRVLKRAQYEALEFSLFDGDVLVRNASHANPSEHEYRIQIEGGRPVACSCPADANYEGACKHRVGVALRGRVLELATAMRVRIDGGQRPASPVDTGKGSTNASSEDCACSGLRDGFPCWECVRAGKRSLSE